RRDSSLADAPASCSFRMEMIFSSLYRLRFISGPPSGKNTGKSHIAHGSDYGGTVNGDTALKQCPLLRSVPSARRTIAIAWESVGQSLRPGAGEESPGSAGQGAR